MTDEQKMVRLEDLQAVKDLRALEAMFPDHYTAQHRIEWMTRRLPDCGGKTPIDLAFEGRTDKLRAVLEIYVSKNANRILF